jgi:DNA polymerase-3 subunit epsilon
MQLNLKKPICFFDLETTAVNVVKDRIVEISIIKINIDNTEESKTWLINPEMPIPKIVSAIHGIDDEMVKNEPIFKEYSNEIYHFIKDCVLAGFNSNKFDIPLLAEELLRSEIDFDLSKIKTVDVQNIFHKMEKRTLGAAYKFYCGKVHD